MLRYKILVVDDYPLVLRRVSEFLRNHGYQVDEAANGDQALEKISRENYGLIISDIRMPGIDGLRLLELAKVLAPATPVVLMSGDPTISRDALKKLGAYDFVPKLDPSLSLSDQIKAVLIRLNGKVI